jgi:hypothetical protein
MTTMPFQLALMSDPLFQSGDVDLSFLPNVTERQRN